MNQAGVVSLIKGVLSSPKSVYADFVPENKSLPAITYSHVGNGFTRIHNGRKTGKWDTWRIRVIGDRSKYLDCQAVRDELLAMDNISTDDFTNCYVIMDGKVPSQPEDETIVYYLDIRTYDKA